MMIKKATFIILFAASPAAAQFFGGGCPSGGFVDRYSAQNISGEKTFCSTATFNTAITLGLNDKNIIGLAPASSAPASNLYWGNKEFCFVGGSCGGSGGGVVGVVGGAAGLGRIGQSGRMAVFNSSWSVVDSVIFQDDGSGIIDISSYTLRIESPVTPGNYALYGYYGITADDDWAINAYDHLTIQSVSSTTIQTADKMLLQSQGGFSVQTSSSVSVTGADITLTAPTVNLAAGTSLNFSGTGDIYVNGQQGLTTVFTGESCNPPLDTMYWHWTIRKGLIISIICQL